MKNGTVAKNDKRYRRRTDEARAGLKMNIICCVWAFFTCTRPGRDEYNIILQLRLLTKLQKSESVHS